MEMLMAPFFCAGLMMDFKSERVRTEFKNAPLILQQIACDINHFTLSNFGQHITITRVLGKEEGDSGVHELYRAFDFRDHHYGTFVFTPEQVDLIVRFVNVKYKRIDNFETCLYHSFNGGPYHFHVQTPFDSTMLRGPLYRRNL